MYVSFGVLGMVIGFVTYMHRYEVPFLLKWSHTVQLVAFFIIFLAFYVNNLRIGNERFGKALLCLVLFKKLGKGVYEVSPLGKMILKHKFCGTEMYKCLWDNNICLPHLEKLMAHHESMIRNAEIDLQFSFIESFRGRIYTYGLEPFLGSPRSISPFLESHPNFVGSLMDIYSVNLPGGLKIVITFCAGGEIEKYGIKKAAGIAISISF
jgi:hypothetical protein